MNLFSSSAAGEMPTLHEDAPAKRVRLAYLVSHPIQYQAPLMRRIAQEPDIDLTVLFASDFSVSDYSDVGFDAKVEWGMPLLGGYRHEFLPSIRDLRRTGTATQINYGIFSRLRGGAGAEGYDALWVHGYSTVNAWHGMIAAKSLGVPVLLRAESWLGSRKRTGVRLALKRIFFQVLKDLVDATLPIGSRNADYWRYYLGEGMRMFGMPYTVDNRFFEPRSVEARACRAELQADLRLEPSRPVILFASKLQRRKRCEDLLRAYFSLSPAAEIEPHPYLVIVGDGEERTALEAQVAASGFGSVRFCGFRNQAELPRFFDLASVFVLPSQHEPWGLIVNEVMNAGRAVIVSDDVGCQPDLVTDGVEGCVFPAGDVAALTAALHRVLDTPETAAEMGRRALERIKNWDFEEDVRGLRQALTEVTRRIEP
jgi:glycosyltransferase involved in cell wall biosynthesis